MEKSQIEYLKKDLLKRYNVSQTTFEDADPEDQEFLKTFSFICLLSFDVYIKKMLIEKLIDDLAPQTPDHKHKGDKNQK